ncbi:hypothetical protein FOIG_12767 [Fusarium odoratissimum NRRL 54006]|uniref:Uncharacterized protein n=2 Tax=Fusarium oxysporum species complex TaxID=171631 RepID=X0J087_FUSO5|nr:uncharacterized protein FOIG_12767 [Fusarium odoratissimum NRRL 54006]EXL94572.1 hypothetical protein FOIG_12767 [Fusarium odoratissimum NRRL 54006]TXB97540.1 hypothetical protein FocTR4_00011075 [Fusarium oxysporum f. sp. cubense]
MRVHMQDEGTPNYIAEVQASGQPAYGLPNGRSRGVTVLVGVGQGGFYPALTADPSSAA